MHVKLASVEESSHFLNFTLHCWSCVQKPNSSSAVNSVHAWKRHLELFYWTNFPLQLPVLFTGAVGFDAQVVTVLYHHADLKPECIQVFVFDHIVCLLHRHLDACCTSCVSSHFHLGRVRLPYVMEPLSFQITPSSPSSCTA